MAPVHVDARLKQWIQGLLNESNICNVYNEKIYIMIYDFGKLIYVIVSMCAGAKIILANEPTYG